MTADNHPLRRYGPAVLTTLVISALSLFPAHFFKQVAEPLPPIPGMDKIVHALMYAALTAAYLHVLTRDRRGRLVTVLRVACLAAVYGIVMEICQKLFTTSRTMDPLDALANTVGALVIALLSLAWAHRKTGQSHGQTNRDEDA